LCLTDVLAGWKSWKELQIWYGGEENERGGGKLRAKQNWITGRRLDPSG